MRNARDGALLRNTARATISSSQLQAHHWHSSKPIRNNLGGDMTGLLQDEAEGYEPQRLSRWFASKPDARHVVRKHHTNEWAWHEAKAREYNNQLENENDCNH